MNRVKFGETPMGQHRAKFWNTSEKNILSVFQFYFIIEEIKEKKYENRYIRET